MDFNFASSKQLPNKQGFVCILNEFGNPFKSKEISKDLFVF